MNEWIPGDIGTLIFAAGFFGFSILILILVYLSWYVDECPAEEPEYTDRTCGNPEVHYEDIPIHDVLVVGQIYDTVHARKSKKCGLGFYWLAWITWFADANCCGFEELVAFEQCPPKKFVYARNGKVVEVKSDVERTGTG